MKAEELNKILASAILRNGENYNPSRESYVAEISFKAGQTEGRREVVEWVEANLQYPTRGEGLVLKRNMDWQSKLKEWELE